MAAAAMSEIVQLARGWIGTPYQHQASLRGVGCDCLGLLRGVWRDLKSRDAEVIAPYAPDWAAGGDETLRDGLARHLTAVDTIAPGDVLLFRMGAHGPARHCGIAASRDGVPTLIHARQNRAVREENVTAFWRARLVHIFRI